MKIAIVTTGRFHVLDLARELSALGHDIGFYSYVPKSRALSFGLPPHAHRSLLPYVAPLLVLRRLAPPRWRPWLTGLIDRWVDCIASWRLEPCDVLIGMSGICVRVLDTAKQRYGAKVVLERGSRHIESQRDTLDAVGGGADITERTIAREKRGYSQADLIMVPSEHVRDSFVELQPALQGKLRVNPYGVDLAMFPPTSPPPIGQKATAIFVGTWCRRKGCDVLIEAWRPLAPALDLLHVGPVGDLALPKLAAFTHRPPLDQRELTHCYAHADFSVHPSREEGLSLVIPQAVASGLPVVCTTRTGGRDVARLLGAEGCIHECEPDDPDGLRRMMQALAQSTHARRADRSPRRLVRDPEMLSWEAYGKRYCSLLEGMNVLTT